MSSPLPVVILAGGEGRRIGGGKPARMLGGRTLLDRTLSTACMWSDLVAVAVRSGAPAVPVPVLRDDPEIAGPLGGLAAALRYARDEGAEWVLTLPCDMPFVPADLPDRLSAEIGAAAAAIAMSGGEIHPVCGLWHVQALKGLEDYLASGRRSLRGFAKAVGYVTVAWPRERFDPFFNINDERDLEQAEALLAPRH